MAQEAAVAVPRKPRPPQIAVYTPAPLFNLVRKEAERRRRKLGPTVIEILWEYFKKPAAAGGK